MKTGGALGLAVLAFLAFLVVGSLPSGSPSSTQIVDVPAATPTATPTPARAAPFGKAPGIPGLKTRPRRRTTPAPAPVRVVAPAPAPVTIATPAPTAVAPVAPVATPVPARPQPTAAPPARTPAPSQDFDDGGEPNSGDFDFGGDQ